MLVNRAFRRLTLGFAVSYLGDGMSFVAVAWLAIELAPPTTAGLWVGASVAAYTLPGVVGALLFGRRLRTRSCSAWPTWGSDTCGLGNRSPRCRVASGSGSSS